jgi:hypothetical protein
MLDARTHGGLAAAWRGGPAWALGGRRVSCTDVTGEPFRARNASFLPTRLNRGIGLVEKSVAQHAALIGGSVGDRLFADQPMAAIGGDVTLVAEGRNGDIHRRASWSFWRSLAGLFLHSGGMRPALISAFSASCYAASARRQGSRPRSDPTWQYSLPRGRPDRSGRTASRSPRRASAVRGSWRPARQATAQGSA